MNVSINGVVENFETVVYISPDGNDSNDGSSNSPVRTYKRAFELSKCGGLIYFKPGVYDYLEHSVYGSCIYDNSDDGNDNYITVYGGNDVYIKINNPNADSRDIHLLYFYNNGSRLIGCNIEYCVTNRNSNYSKSIFYYSSGGIYNTTFKIKSTTSFMYCNNNGNKLTVNNCQFVFENDAKVEKAYSGLPVLFKNCLFTGISDYGDRMIGDNNIFDFKYDKFPTNHITCGIYRGKFKFLYNIYLYLINNILFTLDKEGNFSSKGSNLSSNIFDDDIEENTLLTIYNNKDFINTINNFNYNVIKVLKNNILGGNK